MRWIRFIAPLAILLAVASAAITASPTHAQATTTVAAGDIWFCDASFSNGVCSTTIDAGDTVVWDFGGSALAHTTTDCGGDCDNPGSALWDSGIIDNGGTFQFTFNEAGTFLYNCSVHPDQMRGQITVQDVATEDPGEPDAPTDGGEAPAGDTAPAQTGGLPAAGQGPTESGTSSWWLVAAFASASFALAASGVVAVRLGKNERGSGIA